MVTVADQYQGKRLNSPNDVVVKSDGAIYFTDPPYGIQPEEREQPYNGVYHHLGRRRHAIVGGRLRTAQWPGLFAG